MATKTKQKVFRIPNICRNTSVLMTILLVEIIALIFTLIVQPEDFFGSFGMVSLYLLWMVLLVLVLLCVSRKWIAAQARPIGIAVALAICLCAFILTEGVAQYLLFTLHQQAIQTDRFWRLLIAVILASFLLLRFFSLLDLIEHRHKSEEQSRVQALQSRIRPHFLFNCLNTIAELTIEQPKQAEKAIWSLSKLFRASLDEASNKHSLDSEIHLCERYFELEQWRLGDNLVVHWQNQVNEPRAWQVPKLILQPLVENSVVYGKDAQGRNEITIDLKETNKELSIMIVNNVDESRHTTPFKEERSGNGIALDNIRERLFVLYDDRQAFKISRNQDQYKVIMRIPKEPFIRKN